MVNILIGANIMANTVYRYQRAQPISKSGQFSLFLRQESTTNATSTHTLHMHRASSCHL